MVPSRAAGRARKGIDADWAGRAAAAAPEDSTAMTAGSAESASSSSADIMRAVDRTAVFDGANAVAAVAMARADAMVETFIVWVFEAVIDDAVRSGLKL
mmetsp:Transcript_34383/g.82210  ORF Transcript_34383/g.82210 Transcript_34383/m.82210 type:complete len:99 (-) Transcript_34383:179-475(-)